jgi:hypothetical protein
MKLSQIYTDNRSSIDFVAVLPQVAQRLLGPPNQRLSKRDDVRFGAHGSMSIDIKKGTFFDFEANAGGGVLDLIVAKTGCADHASAMDWMDREGFLSGNIASNMAENRSNGATRDWTSPRIVTLYKYADETGKLLFQVVRLEPKSFRQRRPDGHGGWVWSLGETRRVLYRLPELIAAVAAKGVFVVVVEGERDVDTLRRLGVPATTCPGGAGKWRDEYSQFMRGADVVLIPDCDEPGRRHMQTVAASLHGIAARIRVVDLAKYWPACPPKGDISDWLAAADGTPDEVTYQFIDMVEATPEWSPAALVTSDGWPKPDLTVLHEGRRVAPPLPVELFGPFWCKWIQAAAEGANCPMDYVAMPLLAGVATLIGNSRWVSPWRGWREPSALWLGSVGSSGTNKSPGADPVLDNIRSLEAEQVPGFEAKLREWEVAVEVARAKFDAWKAKVKEAASAGKPTPVMPADAVEPPEPIRPRLMVADTTQEKLALLLSAHSKGLLLHRDELFGWLGSFDRYSGGGGERAFWIEAYGGRQFVVDRVKLKDPIVIPHLTINIPCSRHEPKIAGSDDAKVVGD